MSGTGITAIAGCGTPPSTILALMKLGYYEEARAWRDAKFSRRSPEARTRCRLCMGWAARRWLPELTLPWLKGYADSSPVRIGNAACDQMQIDVFGEIADAAFQTYKAGMPPAERGLAMRPLILEYLTEAWRQPDEGIWEVRGGRQHFVHSKVMAWVAFDRAANEIGVKAFDEPGERWRAIADEIHAEVCERGFDRDLNSFVQAYGVNQLSTRGLLLIPLVGFLPADDPGSGERCERSRRGCSSMMEFDFAVRTRQFQRRPAAPARGLSWPAAFGWWTITFCRAVIKMLKDCLSGCSPAATTWGCWRKSSIRRAGGCLAIFPRPTATLA